MKIVESSKPLVSKTRTGNDKFWQAHVVQDGTRWGTQTSFWQINKAGVKSVVQFSDFYESLPKNVGKANSTTAEEQARSEFQSMVKKQMDKGYAPEGEESGVLPLPMLAQKFSERGKKMQWPVYVQPKYNGMRMLYDGKKGWSRGGKEMIPEVIQHLHFDTNGIIVDGELLLKGNQLLQETMKAAKKYRPELSPQLEYVVYDIISDKPFSERYKLLRSIVTLHPNPSVKIAPTYLCEDIGDVMSFQKRFVANGFEGTICRDDSKGYEIGQRSNQLQKYKDFVDAEFLIVDVVEGDGRFKGAAIFVCKTKDGQQFNCTPEGDMTYRKELFTNRKKHIGKWLTIRYQELSNDKVPIFPVGVAIREKGDF